MVSKNKNKGTKFERDLVKYFRDHGLGALRAWGSNGLAIGETKETDLVVNGYRIQAKKGYNQPTLKFHDMLTGADVVIWEAADKRKTSYGPFVIMEIETLVTLLGGFNDEKTKE